MPSRLDEDRLQSDLHSEESSSARLLRGITSHAIFELDADGRIVAWSPAAASLYGYLIDEMVDRHLDVLFADEEGPNPDLEALLAEARTGGQEIEHWNERDDGSVFWATLTLSPLGTEDFDGYVVVSEDTTVSKQYEQMLERQNDRLKEFTDVIAHDLRNPLNVIDGRLELFRETRDDAHIDHVEETIERMERLVDDLLRVARQGNVVTDPAPTDLEAVVERAWEGIPRLSDGASLEYDPVGPVGANSDRLCELFENLFRNAVEHGGTDVTVHVGPLDHGFFLEDDGPGIPPEHREAVFDHGYSSVDDGSGYGLSVVRTIANAHGWDVRTVEGEDGGARFEVTGVEFVG